MHRVCRMEASQLEVRPEEAPEAQAPVARRKRSGPRSQSSPYTGEQLSEHLKLLHVQLGGLGLSLTLLHELLLFRAHNETVVTLLTWCLLAGVTRYKRTGKYEAHVWIKKTTGKGYQFHLGSFETIEDAARCYDRAAIKTRGLDNLKLNFPAETYRNDAFLLVINF